MINVYLQSAFFLLRMWQLSKPRSLWGDAKALIYAAFSSVRVEFFFVLQGNWNSQIIRKITRW